MHDLVQGNARRDGAERNHLTARDNGGEHRGDRAGEKDEHHALRRLLYCLEQRVSRGAAEKAGILEHVCLRTGAAGGAVHALDEVAHLVNEVASDASGSEPLHVGVSVVRYAAAVVAGAAAVVGADHALRQVERGLLHAGARRAHKEVRVREAPLTHGGDEKVANARLVTKRVEHGCGARRHGTIPSRGHGAPPPLRATREARL